jgi:hypothetical protein
VRQVVYVGQAVAARYGLDARQSNEVDVIDADVADRTGVAILPAPAVNKVDQAVADTLDCRDVQFHRPGLRIEPPGAKFERAPVRIRSVVNAKRDCADRWPMQTGETLCERIRLCIDDEVDLPLAIESHLLVTMSRHGDKAHLLEKLAECGWIGCGVFDEFEAGRSHRVVPRSEFHFFLPAARVDLAAQRLLALGADHRNGDRSPEHFSDFLAPFSRGKPEDLARSARPCLSADSACCAMGATAVEAGDCHVHRIIATALSAADTSSANERGESSICVDGRL